MIQISHMLDLALRQHQSGDRQQAEQLYRQILAQEPSHVDALHLLGLIAHQQGDHASACDLILRALRLKPDFVEAHRNLGLVQLKQGRLDDAIASLRLALHYTPDYADALADLGQALLEQCQLEKAADCYRQAIRFQPEHAPAHNSLGNVLQKQGQLEAAAASYRQALRFDPNRVETHINLGIALKDLGKLDEAVASQRRALHLQPDSAPAHNNLGNALREQGKRAEAQASYVQSLRCQSDVAEVHNNLGIVLLEQGKLDEAAAAFRQALELRPDYPEAHKNLGINALLGGNFGAGWPEYEWRWRCRDRSLPSFPQPMWDGAALAGRAILVHVEQGLGDTLQFIRYAPSLHERGGQVLVYCPPALVRLLASCAGIERLIPHDEPLPPFDVHVPLLSLPRLLGTNTLSDVPAQVPYLAPAADLVEHWRARLSQLPGLRVGIAWQGNPDHRGDRWRSVPLTSFAPLADIAGLSLVSLQKGAGREQLPCLHGLALDLGDDLADLADTAAVMKCLDLVVTVDSAMAHLAGALGVPAYVALPIAADWRWLLGRDDSPWYPSLRLFRQSRAKQWDDVFRRIAEACRQKAEASEPHDADALNDRGLVLAEQSKLNEAILCFQQALRRKPNFYEAHNNLGLALQKQGKLEEAAASMERAVQIRPDTAEAISNLGNVRKEQGQLDEAAASYQRALRLKPDLVAAHVNLGVLCQQQGRLADAAACFEQALRLNADSIDAHWNRALLWLLQGDFERGWTEYEWRWRRVEQPPRPFSQPPWDGTPLAGRTVLLHAEQGLGDAIQFARFAPLVRQQGGKVLLECRRPLVRLMNGSPGVERVLTRGEPLPDFDVHAPLLSLPRLLGIHAINAIPAGVPYLEVADDLVRHWRDRLEAVPGFRVGIVWQGNPKHTGDRWRSVPLQQFAPLATLPGISLVSLQKGPGSEQLRQMPGLALDLEAELSDFADTAAVLKSLDLVMTVDSAVAHLAGALGVTAWVALPFAADWRWLVGRDDSPWYPSLRLFRQHRCRDWDDVFRRLAAAMPVRARPTTPASRTDSEILHSRAAARDTQAIQLLNEGKLEEAAAVFREALGCQPDLAASHNNLGVALQQLGKPVEAAESFRQALRCQPDFVDASLNLGNILSIEGKADEALACFQELARSNPNHAVVQFNLGRVLHEQGKLDAALGCYQQAVQIAPDYVDAHNNFGQLLKEQGKLDEALAHFEQALRLTPDDPAAHNHLGIVLLERGKLAEAAAALRQALRLRPDYAEAHSNLGIALLEQDKLDEAVASCRAALRLRPGYAKAHNNLGLVLQKLGKLEEAAAHYREAVRLTPDFADAHNNLGNVLRGLGMLAEARASYVEALGLKPDFSARWNLSLLSLFEGDFTRGFADYECRWLRPGSPPRDFKQPLWQGEPLAQGTILLHAEQGLGDTIHFVRYAGLVKKMGGTVFLECQASLRRLLSRCPALDRTLAQGEPLPPFDVHAPLLSLPRILGTHSLEQIPAEVPYLAPDPELVERWHDRLGDVPGLRVGICWQGNPRHTNDRNRSVPLSRFFPLQRILGVSLVSLQKEAGSEQVRQSPERILDLGADLTDLADTAAALKSLDLVITVDTALAHLAGALAVPVWVALPFAPDWRWLRDRQDSPWYPTMRLFRQAERDNWDELFERIRLELQARV